MAGVWAEDDLVDQRDEVMAAGNRKAYFLKPTLAQDHHHHHHFVPPSPNISSSSHPTFNKTKKSRLASLKAHPSQDWKTWVDNLKPTYQQVWREAGIYEAILASTHRVERNKDLVICLAERWCADTNTFVFPWGEVSISLEDINMLGGFSVLGLPYWSPLTENMRDDLEGMKNIYRNIRLSIDSSHVSAYAWLEHFMCSGDQFEHTAFLLYWLTKFVFARGTMINVHDFDLAILLSKGTRIALAPLILASIYNDMTLLHKLMSSRVAQTGHLRFVCHIELVQMWAWERFPQLRPPPVICRSGEPRSARWSGVTNWQIENVRAALDSAEMSFVWRPYAESDSYIDAESLVRCMRASELVGWDNIEQYMPHRVARQFGLDQDLPSHVIRSNESRDSAWSNYDRPVRGVRLYIPPGIIVGDVSSRYMNWWKGCVFSDKGGNDCIQNENQVENCIDISDTDEQEAEECAAAAEVINIESSSDDETTLELQACISRLQKVLRKSKK